MKNILRSGSFALLCLALSAATLRSQTVTFTNNTAISFNDTNYDGLEIVVTNCTLTVDGAHAFAGLRVQPGGVLTHIYAATGGLPNRQHIIGEAHTFTDTNLAVLAQTGVDLATVAVWDEVRTLLYLSGTDYLLSMNNYGFALLRSVAGSTIPDGAAVLVDYDYLATPVLTGLRLTVAGVTIQPDGGLPGVVTSADGAYALAVLPSWAGTVTPSLTGFLFIPSARNFDTVTAPQTGADFLVVDSITPTVALHRQGTILFFTWTAVPGVTYSLYSSTNLVDWLDSGRTVLGTNGPMRFATLMEAEPQKFFRLQATP